MVDIHRRAGVSETKIMPARSAAGSSRRPSPALSTAPNELASEIPISRPSCPKVQPWYLQAKRGQLPWPSLATGAPRCGQTLRKARTVPALSRLISTGRPTASIAL